MFVESLVFMRIIGSAILGEMLSNTSLPEGSFSILPTLHEDAHHFSTDANIKLISFTGSVGVGWKVKQTAEKKKVVSGDLQSWIEHQLLIIYH
jgi:acyl-CoA reductase-like NAD-dependent aldehyde dehydrogenase